MFLDENESRVKSLVNIWIDEVHINGSGELIQSYVHIKQL